MNFIEISAVMRKHEPVIDFGYETVDCKCGWLDPDSMGVRPIKDGSRDWYTHLRKQFRAFREEPR